MSWCYRMETELLKRCGFEGECCQYVTCCMLDAGYALVSWSAWLASVDKHIWYLCLCLFPCLKGWKSALWLMTEVFRYDWCVAMLGLKYSKVEGFMCLCVTSHEWSTPDSIVNLGALELHAFNWNTHPLVHSSAFVLPSYLHPARLLKSLVCMHSFVLPAYLSVISPVCVSLCVCARTARCWRPRPSVSRTWSSSSWSERADRTRRRRRTRSSSSGRSQTTSAAPSLARWSQCTVPGCAFCLDRKPSNKFKTIKRNRRIKVWSACSAEVMACGETNLI